jgi:hypothetical protein
LIDRFALAALRERETINQAGAFDFFPDFLLDVVIVFDHDNPRPISAGFPSRLTPARFLPNDSKLTRLK